MEISQKSCRLCLSETEFNISLYSNYCRRTNMIDKILVCLKLVIETTDVLNTICFKCANNVEKYYDFVVSVKKSQTKMGSCAPKQPNIRFSMEDSQSVKRHVTSYVREQVIDADYTFSFLEMPKEENKEAQTSSPFFSYFSPPSALMKKRDSEPIWKTPRPMAIEKRENKQEKYKRPLKDTNPKHLSGDLFASQDDENNNNLDQRDWNEWKFTPDTNIIKRVREKCFGRLDFS